MIDWNLWSLCRGVLVRVSTVEYRGVRVENVLSRSLLVHVTHSWQMYISCHKNPLPYFIAQLDCRVLWTHLTVLELLIVLRDRLVAYYESSWYKIKNWSYIKDQWLWGFWIRWVWNLDRQRCVLAKNCSYI